MARICRMSRIQSYFKIPLRFFLKTFVSFGIFVSFVLRFFLSGLAPIDAGDEELAEWAKQRGSKFFLRPDAGVVKQFPEVSTWASSQNYEPAAVNTFLQVADYYLVAHALAQGLVVVTHEVPANSTKKIKIPNACVGLGIKFMTPYEMLRHERARFVLGGQS